MEGLPQQSDTLSLCTDATAVCARHSPRLRCCCSLGQQMSTEALSKADRLLHTAAVAMQASGTKACEDGNSLPPSMRRMACRMAALRRSIPACLSLGESGSRGHPGANREVLIPAPPILCLAKPWKLLGFGKGDRDWPTVAGTRRLAG